MPIRLYSCLYHDNRDKTELIPICGNLSLVSYSKKFIMELIIEQTVSVL